MNKVRSVNTKMHAMRDCSHIFVSFQTVVYFCDRVSSRSPLFSFFFFLSHEQP